MLTLVKNVPARLETLSTKIRLKRLVYSVRMALTELRSAGVILDISQALGSLGHAAHKVVSCSLDTINVNTFV